jgi:hypothetical protein
MFCSGPGPGPAPPGAKGLPGHLGPWSNGIDQTRSEGSGVRDQAEGLGGRDGDRLTVLGTRKEVDGSGSESLGMRRSMGLGERWETGG